MGAPAEHVPGSLLSVGGGGGGAFFCFFSRHVLRLKKKILTTSFRSFH